MEEGEKCWPEKYPFPVALEREGTAQPIFLSFQTPDQPVLASPNSRHAPFDESLVMILATSVYLTILREAKTL